MKYMIAHNSDTVHYSIVSVGQVFETGLDNVEELPDFDSWIARLDELGVDTEEIERPAQPDRSEIQTSRWRLMIVLDEMGLLDTVNEAVQGAPRSFQIAWNNADQIDRIGKGIDFVQEQLDLSDQQIDEMFEQAKQIDL